jgi:hypothetical protein
MSDVLVRNPLELRYHAPEIPLETLATLKVQGGNVITSGDCSEET